MKWMKTPDKHHSPWQVLQPYLKGAVHQGFVQVDHHAALAAVCDVGLGQQELGWWLRRAKTPLFNAEAQEFSLNTHQRPWWQVSWSTERERDAAVRCFGRKLHNYFIKTTNN